MRANSSSTGGEIALGFLGDAYVILLPAIGLVAVAWIVRRWAPEAQGHGVPEVMYAVLKQGGKIRRRVAGIKALASALCIGTGGSVGREGPIVQIGCSIGSTFGQVLKLDKQSVRLLVACGAAAGIGGTFNAPIAGVIFALEIILGNFSARSFGLVVISSVAATAVCEAALGSSPAFLLDEVFELESFAELGIYAALGVVTGVVSVFSVRILYSLEHVFESWRAPYLLKALLGGLGVGILGYVGIRYLGGGFLFGVGYDGIDAMLRVPKAETLDWSFGSGMTISVMLALCVMKVAATSLTLAAGGSGGVFAPSLFIGAALGGAFGMVANALFPGITAAPGAYALVGMGAVFAGTAHAPITSIIILFEMTGDYKIILPLMIAVVLSQLVASGISADSIYTIKLRRVGGLAPPAPEMRFLDLALVDDAMARDCETVSPDRPITDLARRFHSTHERSFPVVSDDGRLLGIVAEYDVETAIMEGELDGRTVADIMTVDLVTCTREQSLGDALKICLRKDVGQVPVVSADAPDRLIGVLRRDVVLWAYDELASEHRKLVKDGLLDFGSGIEDVRQVQFQVTAKDRKLCFQRLSDLRTPRQSLLAVMRRGPETLVPQGDMVIEAGDLLIFITTTSGEPRLRAWLGNLAKDDDAPPPRPDPS